MLFFLSFYGRTPVSCLYLPFCLYVVYNSGFCSSLGHSYTLSRFKSVQSHICLLAFLFSQSRFWIDRELNRSSGYQWRWDAVCNGDDDVVVVVGLGVDGSGDYQVGRPAVYVHIDILTNKQINNTTTCSLGGGSSLALQFTVSSPTSFH